MNNDLKLSFIDELFVTTFASSFGKGSVTPLYKGIFKKTNRKKVEKLDAVEFTKTINGLLDGLKNESISGTLNSVDVETFAKKINEFMVDSNDYTEKKPNKPTKEKPKIDKIKASKSTPEIMSVPKMTVPKVNIPMVSSINAAENGIDIPNTLPVSEIKVNIDNNEMNNAINGISDKLSEQLDFDKTEEKEDDREISKSPKKEKMSSVGMFASLSALRMGIPMFLTLLTGLAGALTTILLLSGQFSMQDVINGFQNLYQKLLPSLQKIGASLDKVVVKLKPIFSKLIESGITGLIKVFEWMANGIEKIIPSIEKSVGSLFSSQNIDAIKTLFVAIGKLTKEIFVLIKPIVGVLFTIIKVSLPPIVKYLTLLVNGINGLISYLSSGDALKVLAFPAQFMLFTMKWANIVTKFGMLNKIMNFLGVTIGKGMVKLSTMAGNILKFINNFDELAAMTNPSKFVKGLDGVRKFFLFTGSMLDKLGKVGAFIKGAGGLLKFSALGPIKLILNFVKFLPKILNSTIGKLIMPILMVYEAIKGIFSAGTIRDKILSASAGIFSVIAEIPEMIMNGLLWAFGSGFRVDFSKEAIMKGINDITDALFENVTIPVMDFITGLSTFFVKIKDRFVDIYSDIKEKINSITSTIKNFVSKLIDGIMNLIPGAKFFKNLFDKKPEPPVDYNKEITALKEQQISAKSESEQSWYKKDGKSKEDIQKEIDTLEKKQIVTDTLKEQSYKKVSKSKEIDDTYTKEQEDYMDGIFESKKITKSKETVVDSKETVIMVNKNLKFEGLNLPDTIMEMPKFTIPSTTIPPTESTSLDIQSSATGSMVKSSGLVNVHAGEVIGPLQDVRSMIQTETFNEFEEYMGKKRIKKVQRFEPNDILSLSNEISTIENKKTTNLENMSKWTNDLLESGNNKMIRSLDSLKETTKESINNSSSYVEKSSIETKNVPSTIENFGVFLTNTNWI